MSILDKASLIQIPSGYKSTKLYSLRPSNGDGDFTFARSSSATRVNSEGLIEEVPYNLFEQSNDFDTTWDDNYLLINNGEIGYDGSNDAWLLTGFSGTAEKRIRQNPGVSGVHTMSVYAKAGSVNFLWLRGVTNSANVRTFFNLSNGTIGADAAISSEIESVGNDWYRCSATFNQQLGFEFYIGLSDSESAVTSTTGNIYIQDAQVVKGSTAKTYFPTTDRLDVPRLDYSGGASCASLLLEPQRTNLVPYSEQFDDNAAWVKVDTTITANTTISPDGSQNADTMTTTAGTSRLISNVVTGAGTFTISCYVKRLTGNDNFRFRLVVDGANESQSFAVSDEWQRFNYTVTAASSVTGPQLRSSGDGTGTFAIWGAQFEQSSYPTSYIPSNSGSQTTRTADACNGAGTSATFNDSEGVLFAEVSTFADNTYKRISLNNGTFVDSVFFDFVDNNNLYGKIFVGGSPIATILASGLNIENNNKLALKYKENDFALWVNGVQVGVDTSGSTPSGLNTLGLDLAGDQPFYGKTKQLMVFDEALSDEELSDLTGQVNLSFNNLATFYGYTIL